MSKLTDELLAIELENGTGIRAIARKYGICHSSVQKRRDRMKRDGFSLDAEAVININIDSYHEVIKRDRFTILVTSAQCSTPVNQQFFQNLKSYNADALLVIPFRYKNPTSMFNDDKEWWAPEVMPYLCNEDFELCSNLRILGRAKIQPTAVRPLSGLHTVSDGSSAIFGHAKLELKTVATPANRLPKILVTTGCCTVPNYTDSKAGYKGEKRHTISAIVAEVKGDKFFIRQIIADDDGSFIDLDKQYKGGKVSKADNASVLACGDLHGVHKDEGAVSATFFEHDSMMSTLKPRITTLSDTLDFQPSHHVSHDHIERKRRVESGSYDIAEELRVTYGIIDDIADCGSHVVIKRSNHDEHFDRWLKETDPRKDDINWRIWCEAFPHAVDGTDPYKYFAQKWLKSFDKVRFLERDEQFIVDGVSHDGHGDLGANGSRGSLQQFTHLGSPANWDHSHTPGIMDEQYQNGTLSKLFLGYNRGASSWVHCNTVQYANGKRSLLFIIDGKWKFED